MIGWGRNAARDSTPPSPRTELCERALQIKGFLDRDEGMRLFALAYEASRLGACVEIGSYCGRSALFLGEGCRLGASHPLFTVDHHRGSIEQQPGGEYFDPELYDTAFGRPTTLEALVRIVHELQLDEWIVPVVGSSSLVGRYFLKRSLGLVFIDGSHAQDDVRRDYETWEPRVASGGYLCFHDIFDDPEQGGQAPLRVFEQALRKSAWRECQRTKSLGVLRRR